MLAADERLLEKVTVLITRDGASGRELLVFKHPRAGVQLPAGTVEPGERIEEAAVREAAEETGLSTLRLVSVLGKTEQALPSGHYYLCEDAALQSTPQRDATLMRNHMLTRGQLVEVGTVVNGFVKVTFREEDYASGEVFNLQTGWIPILSLAARVERHFVHFEAGGDSPAVWEQSADRSLIFRPYWVPLESDPGLHPAQADWLEFARTHGLR